MPNTDNHHISNSQQLYGAKVNKSEILSKLQIFKERLKLDVFSAYQTRGSSFGQERFSTWKTQFMKFLDENLPGTSVKLGEKLIYTIMTSRRDETDLDHFMRYGGEACLAFIDSLKLDVQNDEFDFSVVSEKSDHVSIGKPSLTNKRVFIVHGHDELMKVKTARFVQKIGFEAVILHEQANKGMTVIEKIEANTDVGFAIVLYTGDDLGNSAEAATIKLNLRARQNVVFEHGYLIAKLTRPHVVPLVSRDVELPSDLSGIVYVEDANWEIQIAKEMKGAGYSIDFNKIIEN
jgi:predicted nucleotide-binding protein